MKKNGYFFAAAFLTAMLCGGCSGESKEVITIEKEPYERTSYRTTEVQRGDLEPELTLTLKADGYERIAYDVKNEDLQLDTVYVSVGDRVNKGDILVSFQSESLQQQIDSYQEQWEQNELILEHYTRLMEIDDSLDYSSDIEMLREDINILKLYLEEAEAKLAGYQIIAEGNGTITEMNEYLQNGYFTPGSNLIIQVCGTGNYSTALPEDYIFSVGEVYTASVGVVSYELRVAQITEKTVIFEPISDMSSVSEADELTMVIQKPELQDAVYVETSVIKNGENGDFVYVIDENGYRDAVPVTKGEMVGMYTVITEGLSGGEKVTIN